MRVRSLARPVAVAVVGHLSDCGTSGDGGRGRGSGVEDRPTARARTHACPGSIYTGTVSSYNLVAKRMAVLTHSYMK